MEHGEIIFSVPPTTVNAIASQNIQTANTQANQESTNTRGRGRGRWSFYRNTGENDPYDMSISPLNIFEN